MPDNNSNNLGGRRVRVIGQRACDAMRDHHDAGTARIYLEQSGNLKGRIQPTSLDPYKGWAGAAAIKR